MSVPTETHVQVGLANPYLICEQCKQKVRYRHNPDRCGCDEPIFNYPCKHVTGVISTCPTWSPDEGCSCGNACKTK